MVSTHFFGGRTLGSIVVVLAFGSLVAAAPTPAQDLVARSSDLYESMGDAVIFVSRLHSTIFGSLYLMTQQGLPRRGRSRSKS